MFLDFWVGVSDGSTVVSHDVRHFVASHGLPDDFAELEVGFLIVDLVSLEAALGVNQHSEVLTSFINANDVHHSERVAGIPPDFVVNLDHALFVSHDGHALLGVNCVVKSVFEEDA